MATGIVEVNAVSETDKKMFALWSMLTVKQKECVLNYVQHASLADHTMTPEDIIQYNKELSEGEEEMKTGNVHSHEEVVKEFRAWLTK